MKKVNFFDAYLLDGDDRSIQFTIIVPTDEPGPQMLMKVMHQIYNNKVSFCGGECDSDYFEQEDESDA